MKKRVISLVLTLALLAALFPVTALAATPSKTIVNLLNSQTLYPQKSGNAKTDAKIAEILATSPGKTAADLMKTCYDWLIDNVVYESCFLSPEYTEGEDAFWAVPYQTLSNAQGPLFAGKGVCDNYSAAYTIMARTIGFEAYTVNGHIYSSTGVQGHAWVMIRLGGSWYTFDPQVEDKQGKNNYVWYGRTYVTTGKTHYEPTDPNEESWKEGYVPLGTPAEKYKDYNGYGTAPDLSGFDFGFASDPFGILAGLMGPSDVRPDQWFYQDVMFVRSVGLMRDTGAGTFSPNDNADRAAIVYGLAGLCDGAGEYAGNFTDVDKGAYYAPAVAWASSNGIVQGYGNGRFGPLDPVTREQLVVMIYSYAASLGKASGEPSDLSGFTDAGGISAYAVDAVRWAVGMGLLSGTGNNQISPKGTATRAQVAAILVRLIEMGIW